MALVVSRSSLASPAELFAIAPGGAARQLTRHNLSLVGALDLCTALQRQGVPSKLAVFPDEGHWILKPQNGVFWYKEVLGWLARYLGPTA